DGAGRDPHCDERVAPRKHALDVMDHCAADRRGHADAAREGWQRAFALEREQPFVLQAAAKELELQKGLPEPLGLYEVGVELKLAAGLIQADGSMRHNSLAGLHPRPHVPPGAAEHHALKLAVGPAPREEKVSGAGLR